MSAWVVGAFGEIWPASDIEQRDGVWCEKVPEPRIIASPSSGGWTREEVSAHARLMAAAPEMLEALKALLAPYKGAFSADGHLHGCDLQTIDRAFAVVAKAEGRSDV